MRFPNAVSLKSLESGLIGLSLTAVLNHTLHHRRILTLKAFGGGDRSFRIRSNLFIGFSFNFSITLGVICHVEPFLKFRSQLGIEVSRLYDKNIGTGGSAH
jgi:hypothetical protein